MKQLFCLFITVLTALFGVAQLPKTTDLKNHLVLNGTTNYVNIPANTSMAITGNVTVEAIVRTDNATLVGQDIIFINCIVPDFWGFQIQLGDGKPGFVIFNGNTYTAFSSSNVTPNQTYHIAGVRSGNDLYLYVDGILKAHTVGSSNPLRNSPNSISRIGKPQDNQAFFFGGCLDELRIWNIARTQAEISAHIDSTLAGNESGLVAYYQMNETITGQNSNVKNSALATGSALDGNTVGDANSPYFSNVCPSVYCNSLVFSSLPQASVRQSNSYCFDGTWKNFYDSSNAKNVLTSIDESSQSLGKVVIDEYLDPTAGSAGSDKYMRRHYVVKPMLATTNTKKIRLYYSNADFSDLQASVPTLSSPSQLVVTKYKGAAEDSVYNTLGGTTTFIPSSQIVRGSNFGQQYLEFPVTDFGEFWIHASAYTLPLTFLDFTAVKKGNEVVLKWTTENEINVSSFEVQRSFDGRNFTIIGSKMANNQSSNKYSLNDLLNSNGQTRLYYRVKQIDNDGDFKYSGTITLNLSKSTSIVVSPNPAKNLVYVSAFGVKNVRLLNLDGQVIKNWKLVSSYQYNISDIPNGIYLLEVTTGEASQIEKLIVQR